MSASLSRGTGRSYRPVPETVFEPDDEWVKITRSKIEQELNPDLRQAEEDRDAKLAEPGVDEAARDRIEKEYEDLKATYITIASIKFKERLEMERMRRRGNRPVEPDSLLEEQRVILKAAQRSRQPRPGESLVSDEGFASTHRSTSINQPEEPDDDITIHPPRTLQEFPARLPFYRHALDSDTSLSPSSSLPRRIPPSQAEMTDMFDTEHDESEPGSIGAHAAVSRKQSTGSMSSLRSRNGYWRPDVVQVSPKDMPNGPRPYDFMSSTSPSASTSASATAATVASPRREINSNGRSGIAAAFAQSPPAPTAPIHHQPVRRDSNASLASSRSGGPGSLPRTTAVMPRRDSDPRNFPPRTPLSPYSAAAVPVYTPPPQATLGHSPVKKESTASESFSAISFSAPRSRSPLPPIASTSDSQRSIDSVDDEPLLQRPDIDTTGRSWSSASKMQRNIRHRTSSSDFQNRRPDQRPASSASRPSPVVAPSSPESYRAPPSSFAVSNVRRLEEDDDGGIPIPAPSERALTAPQASPEWQRPFPSRSAMRRKTSFTVEDRVRNASISPESARMPYGSGFGRRNSASSHHSGRSSRSYASYADAFQRNPDEYSRMTPYAEQSHDGSAASDDSDVEADDFDEEQYFEELRIREEETVRKEEELRKKEEEMRHKEEETKRKEEEMKHKEAEARRKEEVAKRKEEEAKRKEEEVKRKEEEAKRKEEEAKRKEEEAKRKEAEARRKEEDARRKEEDARRKEEEARRKEEDARRKEEEAERKEEEVRRMEEEARKLEEEARRKGEEAERKEEEARKREEALRLKEEEFERMEQEARRLSEEARRRAVDLRVKEEEAIRREEEARLMEEDARRREEDAHRREEDARRKEEDARRKEDDARRREEYARVRAEEAKLRADDARQRADEARIRAEEARIREEILRKREEEFQLKEAELRKREEELERREAASKRLEEEKRESEFLVEFARQEKRRLDELMAEQQRIASELAIQREARAKAEEYAARLQEEEHQKALFLQQQEELSRAEFLAQQEEARKAEQLAEERRKAQAQAAEERRRAEQLAEERQRAEALAQEERMKAERLAEERWKAEALAQEEKRRAELAAQREERRRQELATQQEDRRRQEVARQLEEQRQEDARRRAEQQRRETFANGTERSGTPYSSASQAANTYSGSSRHNSAGSNASDRSSNASSSSWGTNSSWTSWQSQGAQSSSTFTNAKTVPPRRTTSAANSHTPTEPSASRRSTDDDYAKWQERQEEQARKQAEQFRKEQERLERMRQAKAGQMLTKESVLLLFDDHDRQWARLPTLDSLTWSNFPWPMLKKPNEPEEVTTVAIAAYVLNPYSPSDRPEKDRIKEHIRRWHPDRFETKLLVKVRSEDRDRVKEGAGQVVRSLNELLTRSS